MDPDGSRVTRLTLEQQFINDLTWEPRGRQIAFSTQTGIYLVGSDGTQLRQIVSDADGGGSEPTWSPDGGRIAFTSDRVGGLEIYSMNPDGTAQTRLTHAPASVRAHWGR